MRPRGVFRIFANALYEYGVFHAVRPMTIVAVVAIGVVAAGFLLDSDPARTVALWPGAAVAAWAARSKGDAKTRTNNNELCPL